MGNNETRDELAEYCTRLIEGEAWADTGEEAAAHIRRELGWRPPESEHDEANLVAAVAELDAIAKDIRFWHAGELADRLDAIIARRFGYVVRHVGEETANA